MAEKPHLYTVLSPLLLHLYPVSESIVVIIDVFRATSTITTALHNSAKAVIPVDSISECVEIGKQIPNSVTAGERDGKKAPGLQHGNSPLEYPPTFISGKTLVLTTTNGTKVLHMAVQQHAPAIVTGSFPNLQAITTYLLQQNKPVILACAGWKDRVNMEDTLFAGAVVNQVKEAFTIHCDASKIALTTYQAAQPNLYEYIKAENITHYHRLASYGLEEDMKFCLTENISPSLPLYESSGELINKIDSLAKS